MTTPISAIARATMSVGRLWLDSQSVAIHRDEPQIPTAKTVPMQSATTSTVRSRSRIESASWAPAVNRAISRPSAGLMPRSRSSSHAWRIANSPIRPYDSIPRYFMYRGTKTSPMRARHPCPRELATTFFRSDTLGDRPDPADDARDPLRRAAIPIEMGPLGGYVTRGFHRRDDRMSVVAGQPVPARVDRLGPFGL